MLSELEQKMAVLDAELTSRAAEAEKLQVPFVVCFPYAACRRFCKLMATLSDLSWLVTMLQ